MERETRLEERANPSEWGTLQQRDETKWLPGGLLAGSFIPRLSGYEARWLVDMFILD